MPNDVKEIDNKLIQFKKDLQNRFETIKTLDIKEFKIEMIKQGEYPRQFYFLIIAFYKKTLLIQVIISIWDFWSNFDQNRSKNGISRLKMQYKVTCLVVGARAQKTF